MTFFIGLTISTVLRLNLVQSGHSTGSSLRSTLVTVTQMSPLPSFIRSLRVCSTYSSATRHDGLGSLVEWSRLRLGLGVPWNFFIKLTQRSQLASRRIWNYTNAQWTSTKSFTLYPRVSDVKSVRCSPILSTTRCLVLNSSLLKIDFHS